MSGSLEGLSVPEQGASGDYTPADLEKLSASAEALVAGYISLIGQGGGSDGGEVFDFVFDIFSDGLALPGSARPRRRGDGDAPAAGIKQ